MFCLRKQFQIGKGEQTIKCDVVGRDFFYYLFLLPRALFFRIRLLYLPTGKHGSSKVGICNFLPFA